MRPVAVIGNLARDVVAGGSPRIGGPPFYAARALRVLGWPARILTKCTEADRRTLLPRLVALGLPVLWRPARSTSAFSFHYQGDTRLMSVEALGDPWTPEEARGWAGEALGPTEWVHIGALARSDFPAETLAELARGRRLSFDAQGLVRPASAGPLVLDAEFDPAVLRHISILKLAEEEARVLFDDLDERSLRELGVPEIVVTLGSRGSIVFADGLAEHVPAGELRPGVDPTGAGDAFSAAYLVARSGGHSAPAAARRASALVAGLLAGRAR